jgi:hypothetical protein
MDAKNLDAYRLRRLNHQRSWAYRPCATFNSFSPAAFSVSTCFAKWKRMKRCSGSRKKLEPATPISRH